MPTTSNFGWTTPADTDLVKDGAAAIRTLGNGVDASLVDLKGGTTGQVLSKATNTDLDYTWITPNVGDITEVQAGTGISIASGTGPIPVITNTATTTIDAEGDLLVGDAADALQRLAIGSNGNVLTVDTSVDGKIKWAAPAGGGKVLQVLQQSYTTNTTSSSSTLVDTGITLAITPSSASSKVLCIVNVDGVAKNAQNAGNAVKFSVLRGATEIAATFHTGYTNSTLVNVVGSWSSIILDSPATTSATTYKVQFANNNNGASVEINYFGNTSTITLMEIGA